MRGRLGLRDRARFGAAAGSGIHADRRLKAKAPRAKRGAQCGRPA
jgi:hypothetical protein